MAEQLYGLHTEEGSSFRRGYPLTQSLHFPNLQNNQTQFMPMSNEAFDFLPANKMKNNNQSMTYGGVVPAIDMNNNNTKIMAHNTMPYFNSNQVYANQMDNLPGVSSLGPMSNWNASCQYANNSGGASCVNRNRYMPYNHNRACAAQNAGFGMAAVGNHVMLSTNGNLNNSLTELAYTRVANSNESLQLTRCNKTTNGESSNKNLSQQQQQQQQHCLTSTDPSQTVTLQITNLDYSLNESSLRYFLMNQLKPITPVVSLVFEGSSFAKVTVPDLYFAKQVVSNLHRKKIGHKRMMVSYTRDSSLTEINTLRCQVAGLLKDVPYYTLPMYKFRELFQSRFKTSISVFDLYKMPDICTINADNNEEKFISLQPELINSLENSPLMEGLQHSVPYCTIHFKREQHKGWAEQEIEPLPNVFMTIGELEALLTPLLKNHPGDIPIATLVHCIENEMKINIQTNENGVNLEHLICCVQGIQIQVNNFGIKILAKLESDKESNYSQERTAGIVNKNSVSDSLNQISREVMELIKMSPKATMKFSRFIPAYHNHFGKQCRVADYGYTKLIELFEALSSVVQIMGDGENRQITLTHRTQVRRFTGDLLRILRTHSTKSVLLSELPSIFAQTQNRQFDITDYGVCNIVDILDGLVNTNIVVVTKVQNGADILISMPKRKQTSNELEKTAAFAGEMVELFKNAPQYTILFQKLVRSYHYHFAYQCRLSDYGFLKLADLMDAICGIVEMEQSTEEDKKLSLTAKVAQRVFAEQCEELIRSATKSSKTPMKLTDILSMHKKKYGYLMQPQTLGTQTIVEAVKLMPYIEVSEREEEIWITCHSENVLFRSQCYRICKFLLTYEKQHSSEEKEKEKELGVTVQELISEMESKHKMLLTESMLQAMKHALDIVEQENDMKYVQLSKFMHFLLSIVRLLERRTTLALYDIKRILDINLTTTFEFGYPNLYTVLVAYPDLFSVNTGLTQDRSEVSLLANCELRSVKGTPHHLYGSLKLQMANKQQKHVRQTRPALAEHNARNCQGPPPAKQRAVAQENGSHPMSLAASFAYTNNSRSQNQQPSKFNSYADNSEISDSSIGILNASSSSAVGCNQSNKENSFSLNNSCNLSNLSFSEFTTSLNQSMPNYDYQMMNMQKIQTNDENARLWDRRVSQQFMLQTENMCNSLSFSSGNSQGQGLSRLVMPPPGLTVFEFNSYEPPKPDTPPTKEMPYWIDPIWTNCNNMNNNNNSQPNNNNTLNIKLPELKSFNVLPMVLSPYTLSKIENMRQQTFNFDNHDRKIA